MFALHYIKSFRGFEAKVYASICAAAESSKFFSL